MFTYTVFGLALESSILPELSTINPVDTPDLIIRDGHVSDALENTRAEGIVYQISDHQFRLFVDNVAKYLVTDGREIVVEVEPNASDSAVRLFLFGSAFGALLHMRGMLPLHGSCIETPKGAVVFVGLSGVGKSTLAAAFYKRGYAVIADDITVVDPENPNTPMVLPGYPQMKLWADSLHQLDENVGNLSKVRPELEKYAFPIRDHFRSEPLPIHTVYWLNPSSEDQLSITPIYGLKKIYLLKNHTYRQRFLEGMGKVNLQLPILAQHIRVCRVERPRDSFVLDELVEMIEKDFSA